MCRKFSFFVSFILVLCLFGNAWGLEWATKDIGDVAIAGSASEAAGEWTILGSGSDISDTSDGFFYVYRPLSGDGSLELNLTAMDNTHAWAKVGPMIRETFEAGSKHALMAMTASNVLEFVTRPTTDGDSDSLVSGAQWLPKELRITRAGDEMIAEYKYEFPPTVFKWKKLGAPVTIPMDTDVTIGMVVCSHDNAVLNTAVLDSVVLTAAPYEKAWDLSPEDGTTRMSLTPTLSWKSGDSATSHDVMMGTDPEDLSLAATVADSNYTPAAPLVESTTYYWQIVEQPLGQASVIKSFRTMRTDTGMIDYCLWFGIPGTAVSDLTSNPAYPHSPTQCGQIDVLDSPPDIGEEYGLRAIGYLSPETSGDYTFWIASDDASQLWLSLTDKACDAQMICQEPSCCHGYDGTPQQKSAAIPLVGGEKYPIWVLFKEGTGGDYVRVAWEGPDAPSRTEIEGYYLMPGYTPLEAINPSPADGATLTVEEASTVSWTAGETAVAHDVYLGTDPAALSLLTTVAMPDTTAALPALAADTTYYWKVDADDGTDTHEGCTQSFSTVEWASMDISSWGGSAIQDGDCWTILANGSDIWNQNDGFHFVYQTPTFTRDTGTIIAHVASLTQADWWTKAGVMIRETTADNSKNAAVLTTTSTGANLATFQWREETGDWTYGSYDGGVGGAPEWVKLVREGNLFTGYYSEDGENWTKRGEHTVNMDSFVRVGLAVTSHNPSALTTAQICDVSITTPDPHQAWGLDPRNGATGLDIHTTLKWGAGDDATEHRVYFSEDEEAVVNRTVAPVILPAETTELYVGPLDLTKTYYWCVDEVFNPVIQGEVVSFTVQNYRLIDDFEVYHIEETPPPEQAETQEGFTVYPEDLPEQVVTVPGEIIPGYTIPAVAPDSACLIAEWMFEGNFDDTSGSGFHGTAGSEPNDLCTPTIVTDADANRGGVLSLDGDLDYVDCGNPAALNFEQGNWSLSVWSKNTMTGTGDDNKGTLIANGADSGGGHRYCLILSEQSEGKVNLVIDDNAAGDDPVIGSSYNKKQITADTAINDDVWHHTLGVRDGDTITIYTDGVPEKSMNIGGADYDLVGTVQSNVLLGAISKADDGFRKYKTYAGLIDDARIYDCALTEENARFLAEVGDLVVPPVEMPSQYGPLLVHYEFEDNADDSSLNLRHGTEHEDGDWPKYGDSRAGLGRAIEFNDDGDHVFLNDTGYFLNGLDELTVSCWIKSEKTDRDEGWVHFGTNWGDSRSFRYDKDGASSDRLQQVMKYGVATNEGNEEDESSDYVQTTNWQHAAMTWQSGVGIKLYIDGVLDNPGWDAAARGGVTEGYSRMLVGKGSKDDGGGESWNGFVDDVRVYSTALTYGQIRTLADELDPLDVPPVYGPLIAAYDFDSGDASDSSGNNNDGTPLGDPIFEDGVLKLDGDGDCVDIGRDPRLKLGQGPFSVSLWANLSSWGGSWGNVMVSKRGERGDGWQLRRRGGSEHLTFTTRGPGDDDPEGHIVMPLNSWHHVVAVYDGTQKWVYIDGEEDRHTAGVHDINPAGHNAYIGARANRDNNNQEGHFNGMIDDVQFYRHALNFFERLHLSGHRATIKIGDTWSGRAAAAPVLEFLSAHEGEQCMKVEYTGSGAVTRLEPFGDGKHPHGWNGDFSLGQAQALSLWVKGDPENAPGTLFAQLTTVVPSGHTQRVMYDGDITTPEWKEWNITLKELSTGKPADPIEEMGLPITKIKDVGVGVIGAGSGVVYFDDLRLDPVKCVAQYGPIADFTGDCIVDEKDLRVMAGDWGDGDSTLFAVAPDPAGLVALYEFEGNADDSGPNGYHGTENGDPVYVGGAIGQAIDVDGSGDYIYTGKSASDLGIGGNNPRTVTSWVYTRGFCSGGIYDLGNRSGGQDFCLRTLDCVDNRWRIQYWGGDYDFSYDTKDKWVHFGHVHDGTHTKIYADGTLIVDWAKTINTTDNNPFQIGCYGWQNDYFDGVIDEVHVYDYALSRQEVISTMGVSGLYFPLESITNIHDEEPINYKKVNFFDYSTMLEQWLLEVLWPPPEDWL